MDKFYTQPQVVVICRTLLERQVLNIPRLRKLYPKIAEKLAARIAEQDAVCLYNRS